MSELPLHHAMLRDGCRAVRDPARRLLRPGRTRIRSVAALVALALALAARAPVAASSPGEVVLLHGLNRTSGSMDELAAALRAEGYRVHNLDYPSGRQTVAELARWLDERLESCCRHALRGRGLDFVTHSLGGIVVRQWRELRPERRVRRVVMLSPPNHGSELVDVMRGSALFRMVTGPAGQELGTGPDSAPNRLGPVDFELGVVAGRSSINPLHSWLIPGEDDGTVAIARTRVAGMKDFVVIDANHTFIMQSDEAIRQVKAFLGAGRFDRP